MEKVDWDEKGIWCKGCFAYTVGTNGEIIRKYVQLQEEEETGQTRFEF